MPRLRLSKQFMNQAGLLSPVNSLTAADREKLLVDWNATEVELPRAACVHELIEERVLESPNAIAVVCRHEHLTYSELNARANLVASELRKLGVGPETLVAISVERSLEMIIGLLGILKSGGA